MALIKLTAIVDQISGKLNGTVFSHNKGGAYMRSKGAVSNPQTLAQMAVRATFGAIAASWSQLTEFARESWRQVASANPYINRIGDSKTLSGFAYHQQVNLNLSLIGEGSVQFPPEQQTPSVAVNPSSTATNNAGNDDIQLTAMSETEDINDATTTFLIYATPPISAGVSNFDNQLRLISTLTALELQAGANVSGDYRTLFGQAPVGGVIGLRFNPISSVSGRAGAPCYEKIEVALAP